MKGVSQSTQDVGLAVASGCVDRADVGRTRTGVDSNNWISVRVPAGRQRQVACLVSKTGSGTRGTGKK